MAGVYAATSRERVDNAGLRDAVLTSWTSATLDTENAHVLVSVSGLRRIGLLSLLTLLGAGCANTRAPGTTPSMTPPSGLVSGEVSPSPSPIEAPYLLLGTLQEAMAEVTQLGLRLRVRHQVDEVLARGSLLDQSPAAGTVVTPRSVITVTVG